MLGDSVQKKILIVEDNELNLKLLRDIIEYHGYLIFTTGLGEVAAELARQYRPDLILMDIQLPDITGVEAMRRVKADEQARAIPMVAVTAFAMSGDRANILASGFDDYVSKPFQISELLKLVERYTDQVPRPRGQDDTAN